MKGYIFDLDGVLTDTAHYHYLAWKETADALGIAFTPEDNEHLKGVSRHDSLRWILNHGGREVDDTLFDSLLAAKNRRYLELIAGITRRDLLPGLPQYLEYVKSLGHKVILGSSSKNAVTILARLEILPLFDAVVDGNDVSQAKPDPEVFLLGAARASLPPEVCMVFEDAAAGIAAAKAAGMTAVAVGGAEELAAADYHISGFDTPEALALLECQPSSPS